ncbi:hypothetical protein EVAR_5290_1 [Eumeta japonica]|uniref:Uncharacterized protein n=1 Tax=Eumeta variegata TaxID=151549 RepID=A0A4C1TLY3_EUMVA|nr:hypothetical protein EVAR_5290_1 [Eumeta japonica]
MRAGAARRALAVKCAYGHTVLNGQTHRRFSLIKYFLPRKRKSNLSRSSSGARTKKIARSQDCEEYIQTRLALEAKWHTSQRAAETEDQNEAHLRCPTARSSKKC